VAAEVLTLRDSAGREHRATVGTDGTVTVGDVTLRVETAVDGSLAVSGPRHVVAWAAESGDLRWVFVNGDVFVFEIERETARRRRRSMSHGSLSAPMPATVRQIAVAPGDRVEAGDVLVVLEAMKMELPVRADAAGVVTVVNCREGEMVPPGQPLVEIAPGDEGR
jgi:acetyl/propionyl-CoA carboxylase alpha subunit